MIMLVFAYFLHIDILFLGTDMYPDEHYEQECANEYAHLQETGDTAGTDLDLTL